MAGGTASPGDDDEAITLPVFLMVLASAFMHALWNFAARKEKGDLGVLFVGILTGNLLCAPVAYAVSTGTTQYGNPAAWGCVVATGIIHAFYMLFLGMGYSLGDISTVYPIARGTGVALTGVLSVPILGESLSVEGACGIAAVVLGVVLIGWPKKKRTKSKPVLSHTGHVDLDALGRGVVDGGGAVDPTGVAMVVRHDAAGADGAGAEETAARTSEATLGAYYVDDPDPEVIDDDDQAAVTLTAAAGAADKPELKPVSPLLAAGVASLVGVTICSYSLVDSYGVSLVDPVEYLVGMGIVEVLGLVPVLLCSKTARDKVLAAVRHKKAMCALVGIGAPGTYLVVLFAFQQTHAALVVALREFAVVIGSVLGYCVMKDPFTAAKGAGLLAVVTGVVLVKVA